MPKDSNNGFPNRSSDDSELFIGLVAPVGADLGLVVTILNATLAKFSYQSSIVKMSELIRKSKTLDPPLPAKFLSEYNRINALMDAGNTLRDKTNRDDALTILGIANIRSIRQQNGLKPTDTFGRHAFIFDSLKHPDEVSTLRAVYSDNFICISAYSPRDDRIKNLAKIIAKSRNDSGYEKYRAEAEELVERDAEEIENPLGQSVRETFPLSDLFIQIQQKNLIQDQITRIFRIIFNYPYHTPSLDEMGMFFARAAALRSSDLSRQVGAVITNSRGEIISVGCNEVPRAGGGILWEGESPDDRDFQKGHDANVEVRHRILAEVYARIQKAGWLSDEKAPRDANDFVAKSLYDEEEPVLKNTRLASLIEFGRIVHAEMHALMDATKRGVAVKGCTMYTTTFPCHMCARHLVAAGLERVVYIEPYPKSMAIELYEDSVSLGRGKVGWEGLVLDPFVGVAPRRFIELFEAGRRKDTYGNILEWSEATAEPRVRNPLPTYVESETAAALLLDRKAIEFGIDTLHSNVKREEDN